MCTLIADLDVDASMLRLARAHATRTGLRFLGIVQGRGLVGALPLAQFRDGRGDVTERTLEDLRAAAAEKPAIERPKRGGPVDLRTLALF